MAIFENRIRLEDKEILKDYFDSFEYECSGNSFSSLYMWRNINEFSWEIIGDYLCIEGLSHLELEEEVKVHFMMPPMTKTGSYDSNKLRETIEKAREKFKAAGTDFTIRLVPGHMLEMIKEACPDMKFEEDRPNYDYVYEVSKLSTFSGRKLHSKKNHLNYFKKNYSYQCEEMTSDMVDEIMGFIKKFNGKKEIPESEMKFLLMEEDAMREVFQNIEMLQMKGCVIRIDGTIEAIALGGFLGKDTIVEHIEKANTEYRGLYQLVLSEFCQRIGDMAKYINREEDMDLENLRTMKLSYKPYKLLDKYIGVINN